MAVKILDVFVRLTESEHNIVNGNEAVTLTCEVNGDDITGGYWERINGGPLPNNNNVSSLNDDKTILQLNITEARPDHSGQYYCVVYSQWGMAQSSNALVTITIYPPTITTQPMDVSVVALQDVMFTCEARGFNVKYEWRRHSSSGSIGRQSSFILTRATPPDVDQYYCIAMTEGGYVFSNNVTLSVDGWLACRNVYNYK
ncbi:B-cell receptor CD22-like [Dysidea avara]|uniref:B-cell receptor CD22-like n=1 Tax=Dysidea avara TaxID=196820 RepID=UPI00331B82DA